MLSHLLLQSFLLATLTFSFASAKSNLDQRLVHRDLHRHLQEKRATTTCAPSYKPTASVPTITATGTLPKPTAFVKRDAATGTLTLAGKRQRVVGPNIYWLGLQDNQAVVSGQDPGVQYPSKQRIREAMAIAVAMGANTIRSTSLGVSTGSNYTLQPNATSFNPVAWETIDYSIYAAKQYGLRLIIPFTDAYRYYHGGLFDFVGFAGLDKNAPDALDQFYTNITVINVFKSYIRNYLNHVNKYTKVKNSAEPAIMAWETGMNLEVGYMFKDSPPPAAWTTEIANYIKSLDPNHLIIDGSNGLYNASGNFVSTGYNIANIDILSDHYYPAADYLLQKDAPAAAKAKKAFLIGEFDWTGANGGTSISSFTNQVANSTAAGDMLWSVYGHDDNCCQFFQHDDGYSAYYPNGNNATQQANLLRVVKHWYNITGRGVPKALPAVKCKQPSF